MPRWRNDHPARAKMMSKDIRVLKVIAKHERMARVGITRKALGRLFGVQSQAMMPRLRRLQNENLIVPLPDGGWAVTDEGRLLITQ